jgi:hypothetical protein
LKFDGRDDRPFEIQGSAAVEIKFDRIGVGCRSSKQQAQGKEAKNSKPRHNVPFVGEDRTSLPDHIVSDRGSEIAGVRKLRARRNKTAHQ